MLTLPRIPQSQLGIKPFDWSGVPKRFLNPGELEVLIALVASVAPRGVLEFGVNVGRTARAILDSVPSIERYQGIDVPMGYVTSKAVQRQEVPERPGELAAADPRFELILRPSGSLDLTASDLALCDAVFIDGDHGRQAVVHDTALAHALVRRGGIIIWHDYHDLGTVDVREVLHELADGGASIAAIDGTWIAFQRV
ncbi:MAG: class I SAM-dependent methyltransferase [Burkholderiales bacterium]|nr:class I SAM-dependent methyltransferase [Burkholderiales bacterium]